ncbi:MAG TPA: HAD-IA family hydrolase [Steroidobacteraceae bacterium]|nr:HAD-IA family hydrolase [Steroidobacteraceae bacterium]
MRRAGALRALIFDVDGTLADTEEAHRQAFNHAFRLHGLDWYWSPRLYAELLRSTGGKERLAGYIAGLALSEAERVRLLQAVAPIHRAKSERYRELLARGHVRPRTGVARLMREARHAGVRLAIASTTSPQDVTELLVNGFGREAPGWFSAIATGDVGPLRKPAPDTYLLALGQLALAPEEAIALEDSAAGVRAARAAGLFTVGVASRWTRAEALGAADLALSSLGDPGVPLPHADAARLGAPFLTLEGLRALHAAGAGCGQGIACSS